MELLDHWHPVLLGRELGRRPVSVQLAAQPIVVYRTRQGVAALTDECPHRRMKLSLGTVEGDRLRCRYHGWTYGPDGQGESPATPKMYGCARAFEVREAHGAVWLRSKGSSSVFPTFDVQGHLRLGALRHRAPAPLEVTLDNFCEIEHTPTTHAVFGYELERMPEVTVRFETTDTSVRVINAGPPKRFSAWQRLLLGIGKDYQFIDDWRTYFSPVYSVYDHWWSDPATGREGKVRWRLYIFFTPVDDHHTDVITFAFARSRWPGPAGGLRLFRWLLRRHLDHEIQLDVDVLGGLASYDTGIEGLKLSRFDRVLGLNRERIDRVYRGGRPARASASLRCL